jgi:hypothetical protein
MLQRAVTLRTPITSFVRINDLVDDFLPTNQEWQQIQYLQELTYPFYAMTLMLSKTSGPTIHKTFTIYNALFAHLESAMEKLASKRTPWKLQLHTGLTHAKKKLSKYYTNTYCLHGYVYAIAAILSPGHKLEGFRGPHWEDDTTDWYTEYKEAFYHVFSLYQSQGPTLIQREPRSSSVSDIDRLIRQINGSQTTKRSKADEESLLELDQYLSEGMTYFAPFFSV